MILEAAIDNFNIAKLAVKHGANRLEICSDLANDGLTPEVDLFIKCQKLNVPCFPMVRPQKGKFVADESCYLAMQEQIKQFKSLGADGIVLGLLTTNDEIDIEKIKFLVKLAAPIPVTFHKAIDVTQDILKSTKDLLKTGVKRILTSGGYPSVLEGLNVIKEMHNILGNNIILVAGGKVTYSNLEEIRKELPFCEFHGKKVVKIN